jgi:hypothetical protein
MFKLLILSTLFATSLFAGPIEQCESFEYPVSHNANNFIYKSGTEIVGDEKMKVWRYLTDDILIKRNGKNELWSKIYIYLRKDGSAVVEYFEENWERQDSVSRSFTNEVLSNSFETNWTSDSNKIEIEGVGLGQSVKCMKDGKFDIYFQYSDNLGNSKIKGIEQILHHGFSLDKPL